MIERHNYSDAPGCIAAGHSELAAAAISATVKTLRDKVFSTIIPAPQVLAADVVADAKATNCLQVVADCNSRRFDYNSLAADTAAELRQKAERLLGLFKATTWNKIQIGDELRSIKHQLRGRFTDFIDRELGISVKTAQRCMRISKFAEGKNDIVSFLPPSTILVPALKTTPLEIVEQVIARARSGDIVRESVVKKMISDEREKLRLAQRQAEEAALSAASKCKKEKAAAERAVRRAEKEQKQQNAQAQAKSIVDHLSPADLIFIAGVVDDRGVLDELFKILQRVRAGGAA
jgi:hypothetical protein